MTTWVLTTTGAPNHPTEIVQITANTWELQSDWTMSQVDTFRIEAGCKLTIISGKTWQCEGPLTIDQRVGLLGNGLLYVGGVSSVSAHMHFMPTAGIVTCTGEIHIFPKNTLTIGLNRTLEISSANGKIWVYGNATATGHIINCNVFWVDAVSEWWSDGGAGFVQYSWVAGPTPNITPLGISSSEYDHLTCGGTFNCFYGFVNIMTKSGLKQIQDLKRGDLVHTNDGFQPLAKLEVGPNPTQELLLKHLKTTEFMLKIPSDFFLPGVPNEDVYVTKCHPVSVKVLRQGDFEFLHLYMSELVSLGLEYVQLEEKYVYNLIFDKHYELNVGGIKFLSHHPNHNNGNTRLEIPFMEKNRSKKVYADENGVYLKRIALKQLLKDKPAEQTDLEFLGGALQFTQVKQPLLDKTIHN